MSLGYYFCEDENGQYEICDKKEYCKGNSWDTDTCPKKSILDFFRPFTKKQEAPKEVSQIIDDVASGTIDQLDAWKVEIAQSKVSWWVFPLSLFLIGGSIYLFFRWLFNRE
jgi:hypothetical protein